MLVTLHPCIYYFCSKMLFCCTFSTIWEIYDDWLQRVGDEIYWRCYQGVCCFLKEKSENCLDFSANICDVDLRTIFNWMQFRFDSLELKSVTSRSEKFVLFGRELTFPTINQATFFEGFPVFWTMISCSQVKLLFLIF